MALASVLRCPELPGGAQKLFPALPKGFEDDPEDREGILRSLRDPPGPPRVLAAPPWGFQAAPAGPGLLMLHGTTTLAFKSPHGVTVAVDS
ncbi:proteasome subunit beta type-5-like [Neopelma chrysocephalum]|uniref:proteasome subunit beta type-5-like n=1 Tax=Neopelma chrysocephalum TaxID=114329 RepID=UPI000FCD4764|nr:proteasome subunit beta type-5-like [Neopelma chrysocephalum]